MLTFTGLLVGSIFWGSAHIPEALWAPGHLSRYHADVLECTSCHEPFSGPVRTKCLACHPLERFYRHAQPAVARFHQGVLAEVRACHECHPEHRGVLASITLDTLDNPHGEFVFRVSGTVSCSNCHLVTLGRKRRDTILLKNSAVQRLLEGGAGAHKPGAFARCLDCHRGGQVEVEGGTYPDRE